MKIKIDYRGKLHSIGDEISSMDKMIYAIRARYPANFPHGIIFKIGDREVHTFEQIISEAGENALSVKIAIFEKEEKGEKKDVKIYQCWKCKNKKSSEGCVICEGEGELSSDHPFVQFCEELIQDKVTAIITELKNKQSLQKKQSEQKKLDLQAKFTTVPVNYVKTYPDSNYGWSVSLTNNGTSSWPETTSVYRLSNNSIVKQLDQISPERSITAALCLRSPQKKQVSVNQFRLGYHNGKQIIYFGPKFGFQLDTNVEESKITPEEEYTNEMRKMINECVKYVSHQRHSIEYLVDKMRQFGISTSSGKEFIIDIILQLQGESM